MLEFRRSIQDQRNFIIFSSVANLDLEFTFTNQFILLLPNLPRSLQRLSSLEGVGVIRQEEEEEEEEDEAPHSLPIHCAGGTSTTAAT